MFYSHYNKNNILEAGKNLQLLYLSLEQVVINFVYLLMKGLLNMKQWKCKPDIGLKVEAQQRIKVYFRGREAGDFFADLVINELVILELKATTTLIEKHEVQLVNYLKATPIEIGFLLNFGTEPEFERKIWFNEKKKLRAWICFIRSDPFSPFHPFSNHAVYVIIL